MFGGFSAQHPKEILNVIKGFGSAEIKTGSDGDPIIMANISGVKFQVLFYGYNNGKSSSIQFRAGWSGENTKLSTRELNNWNKKYRYTKICTDNDGDTVLMMDVHLPENGSTQFLKDVVESWMFSLLNLMKKFIED